MLYNLNIVSASCFPVSYLECSFSVFSPLLSLLPRRFRYLVVNLIFPFFPPPYFLFDDFCVTGIVTFCFENAAI